jgi:dCTP diphosphatase
MTDLQTITHLLLKFRDAREWSRFHTPKDLAAALSVEIGELQEHFLWKSEEEILELKEDQIALDNIRQELADVLIYTIYLAEVFGVDLANAALDKIAINEARYPVDKSRGSHRKYIDLD